MVQGVGHSRQVIPNRQLLSYPVCFRWEGTHSSAHQLDSDREFHDWAPILHSMAAFGIYTPGELAQPSRSEIAQIGFGANLSDSVWKLRRASSLLVEDSSPISLGADLALFSNASALALSFRKKSITDTDISKRHVVARTEMGLDPAFDKAGPAACIRFLEKAHASSDSLIAFLNTGDQVNTLRQVQGSLRCVAAGVQCWASFCDLLGVAYFPPNSTLILRWSTLFKPGRTFGEYVAHLAKACQLLNIPPTWHNFAVMGVIHGLGGAHDISFKFETISPIAYFARS